jgi:DeoR/GlpR family transcriptional regulator of sugar metabolism
MKSAERQERVAALIEERGFLSVGELGELCHVSEMTIRRDLERLSALKRVQRTHGGAVALRPALSVDANARQSARVAGLLHERLDVLITTTQDPRYDVLTPELAGRSAPLIAESLPIQGAETLVAVDDYQAGLSLGVSAGRYVQEHFGGHACVLDLTYHLSNTQARSRGFLDGVRQTVSELDDVLSLNPQSRGDMAYQLTRDALSVHPDTNVIFAINDTQAGGAIRACKDLGIAPERIILCTFGLEGATLRDELMDGEYCRFGLAMFPEIMGQTLVEAAIAAYNRRPLPPRLSTPFAVLTRETLPRFYARAEDGWQLRPEAVRERLTLPGNPDSSAQEPDAALPSRIGIMIRFMEHEWYRNIVTAMRTHASPLGIEIVVLDLEQTLKDELDLRRQEIARCAAQEVAAGDVILIDGGPTAGYLAEELRSRRDITVISNAVRALDALADVPEIILISTGGVLRRSTGVLVGPTAESALRALRADKLFLMVAGITLDFGLSHTDIGEVTIKQAMIRSAREVILLADHTCFGHESMIQVAPPTVVHKLVTDNALPASWRLDLSKLGIQVALACA